MSGVRHLVSTQARVLQLYEGGWGLAEIRRHLSKEGLPVPSPATLWYWTHPGQQTRNLAAQREARARSASFAWPGVRGPEWKLARMQALRAVGLSFNAIAAVMAIDFPADPPMKEPAVRARLRGQEAAT